MTKKERQRKTIDAVKQIVAEEYLDQFTIRLVTQRTGINEALVYRDFETKEGLLQACYHEIELDIYAVWKEKLTNTEVTDYLFVIWSSYFEYLLNNKTDTYFLYYYRESSFSNKIDLTKRTQIELPKEVIMKISEALPKHGTTNAMCSFFFDTTLYFAIHILKKDIPYTENALQKIYKYIYSGMNLVSELSL